MENLKQVCNQSNQSVGVEYSKRMTRLCDDEGHLVAVELVGNVTLDIDKRHLWIESAGTECAGLRVLS